jgi:transposase-like protein
MTKRKEIVQGRNSCPNCHNGRIIRIGEGYDGRPKYGCTKCKHTHTNGHKGYGDK